MKSGEKICLGLTALAGSIAFDLLAKTDSYYLIYLLLFALATVAFVQQITQKKSFGSDFSMREKNYLWGLSAGIALCITMANYRLFIGGWWLAGKFAIQGKAFPFAETVNFLQGLLVFAGVLLTLRLLLHWLYFRLKDFHWVQESLVVSPRRVFGASFALLLSVDLIYLFLCAYPGVMTPDSVDQVHQVLTGVYHNHHPFWHTQVIRVCLAIGYFIFGSLPAAVATYSVFSACFLSAAFAFLTMTLAEAGLTRNWRRILLLYLMLMPVHVIYSVTMWKNILFSAAMLIFVTVLFRILHGIGKPRGNDLLFFLSGWASCVWLSNGIGAFFLTWVILLFVLPQKRKLLFGMGAVTLGLSLFMIGPALHILGVRQAEPSIILSVPQQQIARVFYEKKYVSADDKQVLEKYMDVTKLAGHYMPQIADPTRMLVSDTAFQQNPMDYVKTWARLGICYPDVYLRAWIDETRGYYNGGYHYWFVSKGVDQKTTAAVGLPLTNTVRVRILDKLYDAYTKMFYYPPLQIFISIGLHVWLLLVLGGFCLMRRKKDALLVVPALAVVATLFISTPVFSEFRYAYSVFTTLPLVEGAAFLPEKQEETDRRDSR